MKFPTRIKGIPCQVEVTNYYHEPAYTSGLPENCYPEDLEFEFTVLDRKGYEAPWLAKYVDSNTETDIYNDFMELFRKGTFS